MLGEFGILLGRVEVQECHCKRQAKKKKKDFNEFNS